MNTNNWLGTETMARERQAEIEQELRKNAQLRNLQITPPAGRRTTTWAWIRGMALGILGTIATIIGPHAR